MIIERDKSQTTAKEVIESMELEVMHKFLNDDLKVELLKFVKMILISLYVANTRKYMNFHSQFGEVYINYTDCYLGYAQ